MSDQRKELVLVTGGSGFVAAHCIIRCLSDGYRVRTTVRSLERESEVREMLRVGGATNAEEVSFIEADLSNDNGWMEAVRDCAFVLHVASPFPPAAPKHEDDLIVPAREGTLRVLRAARDAGVKRVVVTGAMSAMGWGNAESRDASRPCTEEDWTDVDKPGVTAYDKSKTLAERALWEFAKKEVGLLEVTVVSPSLVLGPVLGKDSSPSVETVRRLISGELPGCPNLEFPIVDVRDVADLHLVAMTHPDAKGERFLCMAPPPMSIRDMSLVLHERLGHKARRATTRTIPNFLIRLLGFFDPAIAGIVPHLGHPSPGSNEKAKRVLGWDPRSSSDAVVATAESFFALGFVKP